MAISALSAVRAHRHIGICLIFAALLLIPGCKSGAQATLTVGAEGFEPAIVRVPAGESFDLEVVNDTEAVQTVVVAGRPGLRISPKLTSTRQIQAFKAGDHKVTLEGTPFEATLRAER
jgi:Cupredoxin-like domain